MSRRSHIKRAKILRGRWNFVAGSDASLISRYYSRNKRRRKIAQLAQAIRGGYHS